MKTNNFWNVNGSNPVTGWISVESEELFFEEEFARVLREEIGAYVVRGFVPDYVCSVVLERFADHPHRVQDSVTPPIGKLGISLFEYEKQLLQYLSLADQNQSNADRLFKGIQNPLEQIIGMLSSYFRQKESKRIRPAQHKSKQAFYGVMREWFGSDSSGLAALIHEDWRDPKTMFPYFETSDTINQVSMVICFSNDENGGRTRIYRKMPAEHEFSDSNCRHGYGFHPNVVKNREFIDVHLNAGDVLVLPSRFLHSVEAVPPEGTPRVTRQMFLGEKANGDIIYWS